MKTYASNPGDVRVKWLRLLFNMPGVALVLIGGGGALLYFGYVLNNMILTLVGGLCIGLLYWVVNNARYRFTEGDVNIAKVLSLNPPLFAISTNMRNTHGPVLFPVIKIVRRKVPNARGRCFNVGDYFPAACLYSGSIQKPHWDNVYPVPLSVATDDLEAIDQHNQDLEYLRPELEARLALVDTPKKPGLYFIDEARLAAHKARPAVPEAGGEA
jgi:hypothetical protein